MYSNKLIVLCKRNGDDFLTVKLTLEQEEGYKIAVKRYKDKEKYTTIAGFAGTGKTFLTKIIIDGIGVREHELLVGAYTGKAAQKLQQTGFRNATTLHKMLYTSIKTENGFVNIPKSKALFSGVKVILIDEISMVPDHILRIAAMLDIHIIMMGDPGQIPPIGKDNGMLLNPHIFLQKIMRQNEDNSIIRLSKMIREGEKITPFNDDFIRMYPREEIEPSMLMWADQIICSKNATRNNINKIVRLEKGFYDPTPMVGDKIIVTENDWDFSNSDGSSLINGLIGEIKYSGDLVAGEPGSLINREILQSVVDIDPDYNTSVFTGVKYDALPFVKGIESYRPNRNVESIDRLHKIDFGYAITTHKSQGSEYSKVLGIEEIMKGGNSHVRLFYTLITRAEEKLIVGYDPNSFLWDTKK